MRRLLAVLAVASLAMPAMATETMTLIWRLDDSQPGAPAWLNAGNTTRGMAYNPSTGNLLVADRDGSGNYVRRLNGGTGAEVLPPLDNTAYSAGTFVLNKVRVADDGRIFVTNLAAATSTFKIYVHDDETTPGHVGHTQTSVPGRLGDDVDVIGSGVGTKIIVTGSGNTSLNIYTTTNGYDFSIASTLTPSNPAFIGIQPVAWHTDASSFWTRKAASTVTEQTTPTLRDSTGAGLFGVADDFVGYGPIAVRSFGVGKLYLGTGPSRVGTSVAPQPGVIYNVDVGSQSAVGFAETAQSLQNVGTPADNGNGSGDVSFDVAGQRAFFLVTNNSISAWNVPNPAGVEDWNLF
jgi:hypothetical protein